MYSSVRMIPAGEFDGDHVEIVLTKEPEGRSREGKIVKILERGLQSSRTLPHEAGKEVWIRDSG